MLGMVFTELVEWIESECSVEVAEQVLAEAGLGHGGAYTAVGSYDAAELGAIVQALVRRAGGSPQDWVQGFGRHLMHRFTQLYPALFAAHPGLFDFLAGIDGHIHVEVRRLYPQAQPPVFEVRERDLDHMLLAYRSPHRLQALALGLLEGAIAHYGGHGRVAMRAQPPGGEDAVLFDVWMQAR